MGIPADFPATLNPGVVSNYRSAKWRLRNLYYVRDERGEKIRFVPNWVQEDLLAEM